MEKESLIKWLKIANKIVALAVIILWIYYTYKGIAIIKLYDTRMIIRTFSIAVLILTPFCAYYVLPEAMRIVYSAVGINQEEKEEKENKTTHKAQRICLRLLGGFVLAASFALVVIGMVEAG